MLDRATLVEAKVLTAEGKADRAFALCRDVALAGRSEEACAEALKLIGRHYEVAGQFDKAALAYAGKCPIPGKGGANEPR